jgi:hypothetical protein
MDENCQTFTKTFIEIIKNCVPQKEVTIRLNDKVWFNSEGLLGRQLLLHGHYIFYLLELHTTQGHYNRKFGSIPI